MAFGSIRERSCASWGVRLLDSEGLRHLNLLGAPKIKSVFSYFKIKSFLFSPLFFFPEGSFEGLCLLLFLIEK